MSNKIRATTSQRSFASSSATFPAFIGGYASGKTQALIYRIMNRLCGNVMVAYYLPTFDHVKTIGFPRLTEFLDLIGAKYTQNLSFPKIIVPGYGEVLFRSMDKPERIVGYEVADSFFDELDIMPMHKAEQVWIKAMGRNRQKRPDGKPNTMAVATTPEGFRFCYDRWKRRPLPGYELHQAKTTDNPYLDPLYIESLKQNYPSNLLSAYIDGEFVNLTSGTVYRNYDRNAHRSNEQIQTREPLLIGMDFNVQHMAATIYVQRQNGLHAVGELKDILDTPAMIKTIREKYSQHRIIVYPDASGNSRKSVGSNETDISLLKNAGFTIRAKSSNPSVKDRINATNKAFEDGWLHVNDALCPTVAECFEQQSYDKNGEPDKTSGFDHQNDGSTYVVAYERPIKRHYTGGTTSLAGYY